MRCVWLQSWKGTCRVVEQRGGGSCVLQKVVVKELLGRGRCVSLQAGSEPRARAPGLLLALLRGSLGVLIRL